MARYLSAPAAETGVLSHSDGRYEFASAASDRAGSAITPLMLAVAIVTAFVAKPSQMQRRNLDREIREWRDVQ